MIKIEIEITKENLKMFLDKGESIEKYRLCYTIRIDNLLEYVSNEVAVDGVILKMNISKKELVILYALIELMKEEKALSEEERSIDFRKHKVAEAERKLKCLTENRG